MAEMKRIEVGFGGGQVMSARVSEDDLKTLREAVQRGHGWHDLDAEDGPVSLDTAKVTWSVVLDTVGQGARGPIVPPAAGDVWDLKILKPITVAAIATSTRE